jgi:hypothetical protein
MSAIVGLKDCLFSTLASAKTLEMFLLCQEKTVVAGCGFLYLPSVLQPPQK